MSFEVVLIWWIGRGCIIGLVDKRRSESAWKMTLLAIGMVGIMIGIGFIAIVRSNNNYFWNY